MLAALQPPMTRFGWMMKRILPPLVLAALGLALFMALAPGERRAIEAQLTGFPDSDVAAHQARLWVMGALCQLPALAMLCYGLGGILDRYLTRMFAMTYALCFGSFFMIWLLVDLGGSLGDFAKSAHPLLTAADYYGARSPAIVVLLLPYSLLLSLIYVLGRISREREIVAMIQSGRSMLRLLAPLILAGLWSSLLCMGFNYHWAPEAEGRRREIMDAAMGRPVTAAEDVLFFNAAEHRLWKVGAFPKNYEKGEPLESVEVTTSRPDGSILFRVAADTARWQREGGVWIFDSPALSLYPEGSTPVFERGEGGVRQAGWAETPWQIIRPGLEAGYLGVPDLNGWIENHRAQPPEQQNRHAAAPYLAQRHNRWALPLTCLVMVLLATPLSVHFSRMVAGGSVFLAVALAVFMLFSSNIVLTLGEGGQLPPAVAAWAPNLLFTLLGLHLMRCRIAGRAPFALLTRIFRRPKTA